ncbi:TPA: hypothetical protein ENG04_11325 [Candidatus Poribacteria bacterium]|nr:hypothetical protein [Candidatus Poribacteria bacterium]HEX30660.1 hypothetical protein [Candidatus Poribacteria bacterium]
MAEIGTGKPSWRAMLMSLFLPGSGQIYLRKWGKGILILIVVLSGILISYINAYPSKEYLICNWSGGRKIVFRPVRYLFYTGIAQALAAWIWGVVDGWKGSRKIK